MTQRVAVSTEKLTKYYGKSRGIIDVDLNIMEGEIFGFIGPNGAGKTTTIRLLLNLIFPTSGKATVLGMDAIRDSKEIKRVTGYLPGDAAYYGELRGKDLLEYASGFYEKDCLRRGRELADIFELDLEKRIENLSLGNKKKVGVIQALMHEPKLLILDEPTSGLDPLIQKRFYEVILEENRKGTTVFWSSHVLSEVQKMCDRVAILKGGRVLRVEEVETLRSKQLLKVQVTFAGPGGGLPEGLQGVVDPVRENDTLRFMFSGSVDSLIKALAKTSVTGLLLEEPALEEVFMHYYESDEPARGEDAR
ncbi:MAG TPA: ABC transporter ATP-binding protein [Firmicutes bacterium]|nr:ABC transporter ATP-binding protein [Candidatus Fermentithermobacillaceae bacterium]